MDDDFQPAEPSATTAEPTVPGGCLLEAPSYQKALEWLAVLGSARIVAWPRRHDLRGWEIVVEDRRALPRALEQIQLYEEEARDWPPTWSALPDAAPEIPIGSVFVGLALGMMFLLTGPFSRTSPWHLAGMGDATAMVAGDWWRVITPLTLHSDFSHMGGNAIGCIFLGGAVCMRLGDGIGWLMVLLSGIAGNLLTTLFYQTSHDSVGASTAVFGAVGLLGALRLAEHLRRRGPLTGRGIGVPILVVAAMFSFMGISPGADIMAHLFGALAGFVIGLPAAWLTRWRGDTVPQLGAAAAALSIPVIAWIVAFQSL